MAASPHLPSLSLPRIAAAPVWAGLLAALLLGACGGPRYRRPEVPVPPSYRGEAAPPDGQTGTIGELRWQDLIHDEELSKLISEALANNFDAQIAAARVLEARAQFKATRADRFPALDASATSQNLRALQLDTSYTNLSVALAWELDLWGRIRNATAAARAGLLASAEARDMIRQSLVSDVASAYFLMRDLDLELEITRRALKLREESLELVQLRVENGYSSEIDSRQAEVLVRSARTALTSLELGIELAENQLAILLGRNPGQIVRGRSLLDQQLVYRLPPGLPSTLLHRRPDIRQAEQQLIASHALVAVARADFFPRLALTASTGFESSALHNLITATGGIWSAGPTATMPVFNAGRMRAAVRGAEARREQARIRYRQTVQQAFREVADSLAGSRKLAELRTQQQELVESLRLSVELADLRYRGGVASYLEYLDSERQLLDQQLQLVQLRRSELVNAVTLYRALGGGWQ